MHNNMKLIFRKAKEGDVTNIVEMLADDELGLKEKIIKSHCQRDTMMHSKIFFKIKTKS